MWPNPQGETEETLNGNIIQSDYGEIGSEKTPYLATFHAVEKKLFPDHFYYTIFSNKHIVYKQIGSDSINFKHKLSISSGSKLTKYMA